MAEFVQMMKDWRRMCDTYTTDDAAGCCKGCPMDGWGCGAIYENDNADPEVIERKVNQWVAEHPEPEYPTWGEWFVSIGMLPEKWDNLTSAYMNVGCVPNLIHSSIPADIAQKLGIEPKEDI